MASSPHALVLPYPAQSHIIVLLELSHRLLDRGIKVTFLNTEFNHRRLLAALSMEMAEGLRLEAIPDGLGPAEDRQDLGKLNQSLMTLVPGYLEEFLAMKARDYGEEGFTCFVVDESMAWAIDFAVKAGLRSVAFFPAAAALLAANLSIPKLIEDGVIDEEGAIKRDEMFRLSPEMPPMDPTQLYWNCLSDSQANKTMFSYVLNNNRAVGNAELIICNTVHGLEEPALSYAPNILPVGPLLGGSRPSKPVGNFWLPDAGCIEWLDKKPVKSVIYAAFGSFTIFNQDQFRELALGLELTGRSFLWAVRPDLAGEDNSNLSDFIERVGDRGRIVGWCPQQQVLAHPSIACFISHCGWNSTLEGVRNGVPFLCWPYFCDQFFNQSYICDVWRVGMKMAGDENGIYAKEWIRSKVEELVGDAGIKERSVALKEMISRSLEEGGSSFKNFNGFIDLILGV